MVLLTVQTLSENPIPLLSLLRYSFKTMAWTKGERRGGVVGKLQITSKIERDSNTGVRRLLYIRERKQISILGLNVQKKQFFLYI